MPAYVIGINRRTIEADGWAAYLASAKDSFSSDANALAKFGRHVSPEGNDVEGIAIFEFPSFEQALAWYESEEYQTAIEKRVGASDFRIYIVEGIHQK